MFFIMWFYFYGLLRFTRNDGLCGAFGGGFAGFASNNFIGVTDTFACVGFSFTQGSDVDGDLTDQLFVDALDLDFVVAFDGKGDAGNGLEGNRVTEAERENEVATLSYDTITGTNQLEFLGEAVTNSDNGIVGEGTAETVIGAGKFVFAMTIKFQMGSGNFCGNFFRQGNDEVPLGARYIELSVFDLDFDGLG